MTYNYRLITTKAQKITLCFSTCGKKNTLIIPILLTNKTSGYIVLKLVKNNIYNDFFILLS